MPTCLITSNLPWFMDLTFKVPMQYCSLQHQTLLPSSVTATTGCCFCFGSVFSLFLELFFHWSPVAYWVPTELGSSSFCVLSFLLFRGILDQINSLITQSNLSIYLSIIYIYLYLGIADGLVCKESACQSRRHKEPGFDPWVRKIPWRIAWQTTPIFLPIESHGQRSLVGHSPWVHRVRDN